MARTGGNQQDVEPSLLARIAAGLRGTGPQQQDAPRVGPGVMPQVSYEIKGVSMAGWFTPGQPMRPIAQEEAAGRAFDFPVAINMVPRPRSGEQGVTFEQLRGLADGYDLLRLAIETRKDQIEAFEFEVVPEEDGVEAAAVQDKIVAAYALLKRPDGKTRWSQWLRMLVEELLVIDAVAVYPRASRAGGLYGLELVDGATIKRLIDDGGRTPVPPDPAYQQIIKGVPAVLYSSDQLVYWMRNPRVSRMYGYCYDSETEILTQHRGWVRFADLKLTDMVATRGQSGAFEWQLPSRHVNEQWDGPMYAIGSRTVDLLVTPEHRMLVTALPRALGGNCKRKGEAVITAQQFAEHANHEVKIPVTSTWAGQEIGEQVFEDPSAGQLVEYKATNEAGDVSVALRRKNPARTFRISGDDFCALMGAYIAEGNARCAGGIEVAQRDFSKGFALYKRLFDRIGGGYNGRAFILSRRVLSDYFRQFGLAHEKFVPEAIMGATPRQIRIFWDHYMAGDGHYEPRSNKSGRGQGIEHSERAVTVSRRLADQLVELAQKIGLSASVSTRPCKVATIMGQPPSSCREAYRVNVRYSKAMSAKAERTHYKGSIHCVTVPNGIVYVRRNGKPVWAGNSPVEQVLTTINIALRRQQTHLAHYTEGTVPDGLAQVPSTWTPKQISDFQLWFDSVTNGPGPRSRIRFMPALDNIVFPRLDAIKDSMDDWLARIICFAFSISPSALLPQVNRASGEQMADTAKEEGLIPLLRALQHFISDLLQQQAGLQGVRFAWKIVNRIDPKTAMEVHTGYLAAEVLTPDEIRAELDRAPLTPEQREEAFPTPPPPPAFAPPGQQPPPGAQQGEEDAPPKPEPKADDETPAEKMLAQALAMLDPERIAAILAKGAEAQAPRVVEVRPEVNVEVGDTNIHMPAGRAPATQE